MVKGSAANGPRGVVQGHPRPRPHRPEIPETEPPRGVRDPAFGAPAGRGPPRYLRTGTRPGVRPPEDGAAGCDPGTHARSRRRSTWSIAASTSGRPPWSPPRAGPRAQAGSGNACALTLSSHGTSSGTSGPPAAPGRRCRGRRRPGRCPRPAPPSPRSIERRRPTPATPPPAGRGCPRAAGRARLPAGRIRHFGTAGRRSPACGSSGRRRHRTSRRRSQSPSGAPAARRASTAAARVASDLAASTSAVDDYRRRVPTAPPESRYRATATFAKRLLRSRPRSAGIGNTPARIRRLMVDSEHRSTRASSRMVSTSGRDSRRRSVGTDENIRPSGRPLRTRPPGMDEADDNVGDWSQSETSHLVPPEEVCPAARPCAARTGYEPVPWT